jgi:hypothetical protein
MGNSEVAHNAKELERYFEVLLPQLEPQGGIPDVPFSRKERGSSRPPVSDYVMRLWRSNPHLFRINAVVAQAARSTSDVAFEGRPLWEILGDVLFDHTAIRRWKSEGGADERRFYGMCHLLAQRLAIKHDLPDIPYKIRVWVDPQDEPVRERTREGQRIDRRYRQRQMMIQLEEVEEQTGHRGLIAMRILSERKKKEGQDWSVRKLREARNYVNSVKRSEAKREEEGVA